MIKEIKMSSLPQFNLNVLLTPEQTKEYQEWITKLIDDHMASDVEFPGVDFCIEKSVFETVFIASIGTQKIEFEITSENDLIKVLNN